MNHVPHSTRTRRSVRRLLVIGVAVGSVIAVTAPAASAAGYGSQDSGHDDSGHTDNMGERARPVAHYTFRTLNDPADPTFNQLLGIDDRGRVVGYFGSGASAAHPNKGYLVKGAPGRATFIDENVPGSAQTQVVGINDSGTTVGFFVDAAGANVGFVARSGHFTSVANPATVASAPFNQLLGINRHGIAAGFYNDAAGAAHGYTYDTRTQRFSPVQLPVPADAVTATGVNDDGDVVGFFVRDHVTTGFLLHRGRIEQLSFGGRTNTQALGVNDQGSVVGSFLDAAGAMHGFVWSHRRGMTQVDDEFGAGGTLVNGLNDAGQLVGFYVDAAGNTNGFVASR